MVTEEQDAVRTCFGDNQHNLRVRKISLEEGWYADVGLGMQTSRVDSELGKESKGLSLT